MIAFVRDCILNRAMRVLTNYRWFMSRPLWYVAIQHKLLDVWCFYGFHFSTIFMFHFHFFIVEFSLFWNDLLEGWECVCTDSGPVTDSRQELRISWYWRKIWRNMENVNKLDFREQTDKKWRVRCVISLKFIIEIIFNFGRLHKVTLKFIVEWPKRKVASERGKKSLILFDFVFIYLQPLLSVNPP